MKRISVVLIIALLLCSACKPKEDATIRVGSEDGGGSGYGVSVKSVLQLSDFYFITHNSTRTNNLLSLGTPVYSLGSSDTYQLEDGSRVVLTYDSRGILSDTLYTSIEDGKSYGLFDILVSLGVLKNSGGQQNSAPNGTSGSQSAQGGQNSQGDSLTPVFSDQTYKKATFDGGLSLYLDRTAVVTTFGAPNAYAGRTYKKDSYLIDCYRLDDGSTLMLDYGYDRKSLRCAAIQGADGVTQGYLGSWTVQTKPADFVRPRVELNQITALSKGISPRKVYEKLGEPCWFEGNNKDYKEVYLLSDGATVYLIYDPSHTKLTDAQQLTSEGKLLKVTLR